MFVRDEVVVDAPIARVLFRVQEYLLGDGSATLARDTAGDQEAVLVRAGVSVARKQVAVRALAPVMRESGADVAVSWAATGAAKDLYPSLEAIISVEPIDDSRTRMRIVGSYLPPLGDVGAVIDRVIGHKIAAATVRSFLVRLEHRVLDAAHPRRSAQVLPSPLAEPDGA